MLSRIQDFVRRRRLTRALADIVSPSSNQENLDRDDMLREASVLLSQGADPNGRKHVEFGLDGNREFSRLYPGRSTFSRSLKDKRLCHLLVEYGAVLDTDTVEEAVALINGANEYRRGAGTAPNPISPELAACLLEVAGARSVTADMTKLYHDRGRGIVFENRRALSIFNDRVPGFLEVYENARLEENTPGAPIRSASALRL